jgi:hypothetical protein
MTYDFDERLGFSMGARKASDMDTIMALLDGCCSVSPYECRGNDNGIDYIATLRRGAKVNIDVKTREHGCSRFWKNKEPELAIEIWSVMPGGAFSTSSHSARAGWTLDESKSTDLVLYTFNADDSSMAFLLPFQSLRMAARRMARDWMSRFKVDIQSSRRGSLQWQSQAVFVPADAVISAIQATFASTHPSFHSTATRNPDMRA